jgi:hypothetical protein
MFFGDSAISGSKIDILEEYIRPRGIWDELIYIDGGCRSALFERMQTASADLQGVAKLV